MAIASSIAFAQFDGGVGTEGCQAINISNPNIVSWAKGVEVKRGFQGSSVVNYASYGKHYMAQGKPDSTTTSAISLGRNGEAIITFDRPIINGQGYDFAVFENGFTSTFLELAYVEVSSDGVNYFRFPSISNSTSSADIHPTLINNLAGKYEVGYGTPFDLDDINDDVNLDKFNIRFVKIIDVDGGVDTDSQGNIIYDGSSGGPSSGFDLTGVCVLNGGEPYLISNLEGMLSQTNTYELVSAANGTIDANGNYHKDFTNNGVVFEGLGLYGGTFPCGFGLSNLTTTTGSYYESSANMGLEGPDSVYLNAYYSDYAGTAEHNIIRMDDNSTFKPMGVYVSNSMSTYNYNTTSLPANCYLKMVAYGYDASGDITGTSYIYLADKRNGLNINVKDWTYLNLSSLGECSKVIIKLESNDDGGYGINPPSYFCLDNFVIDISSSIPNLPISVRTLAATNVNDNSATLNGHFSAGNQTITAKGFQYKLGSETIWDEIIINMDETSYILSNLLSDTNYVYRAFAISLTDTIFGEEITFRTLSEVGLNSLNNNEISMNLYPNPSTGIFNIKIEGLNSGADIHILDLEGRIVKKQSISGRDNSIIVDLSSSKKGVYFVKIITNETSTSRKLIIY